MYMYDQRDREKNAINILIMFFDILIYFNHEILVFYRFKLLLYERLLVSTIFE